MSDTRTSTTDHGRAAPGATVPACRRPDRRGLQGNRRRHRRVLFLLAGLLGALLPLAPAAGAALAPAPVSDPVAVTVPGTSNLYIAGHSSTGDGTVPTVVAIPGGTSFVEVGPTTGAIDFGGGRGQSPAEGTDSSGTDLDSTNGISGLLADRGEFLAGVFLGDGPSSTAPAKLDFRATGFGIGWPGLSPTVGQAFFVGDGLDEFGHQQKLYVPEGATRLFLGFGDGSYLTGTPAHYNDNVGQLSTTVTFGIEDTEPPADPEPVSTFDDDAEEWQVTGDPSSPPQHISTGGNPGGFLRTVDAGQGIDMYWDAPSKFLGDRSAWMGGELHFDLRQAATDAQYDADDVVLVGGGNTLTFDTQSNPGTAFTHYEVPLTAEAGWTVGGVPATADQIASTLADLTEMLIRAEFRSGADTDDLDNVRLVQPAESPGVWDLAADTTTHVEGGDGGANPFADSAGNDVWRFAHQATPFGSSRTTLEHAVGCDDRINAWSKDGVSAQIQTTGADFTGTTCIANQYFADGKVMLHPSSAGLAAVAEWTSPIDGTVAVTGSVIDRDHAGGSGIAWRVDGPDATLASGAIPNGGSQLFSAVSAGRNLRAVDVTVGDTIAVVVDMNGGYDYDLTQVDLTIVDLEHAAAADRWDLATDATAHVEGDDHDANPFPDAAGVDTWRFAHQALPFGSARTTLLDDPGCDARIHGWFKDGVGVGIQSAHPDFVGSNCTGGQQWTRGKMMLHPSDSGLAAVAEWTSPITGTVSVAGGVVDRDHGGGSGIAWRVDGPDGTLASGAIPNGGMQIFSTGTGAASLGSVEVTEGDTIAVIVDANGGYHYDLTQVDLTIADHTPAEEPEAFQLSVSKAGTGGGTVTSSPTGVDCGETCTASFDSGTAVTLTASPSAGSQFAGWSGCTADTGTPTSCTVTLDHATAVTATFDTVVVPPPASHTLTVTTSGTGNGAVTATGIDCPGDCTESYVEGTSVQLTATPTGGSAFAGWTGDCAGSGTTTSCTVSMAGAASVGAEFTAPPTNHDVVVTVTGPGAVSGTGITCPTACATVVEHGDSLTLTATPTAGNSFTGWTGDCAAAGSNRTCVVTPTEDAEAGATFERVARSLQIATVTSASNVTIGSGVVTSSPAGIDCGTDCFESYSVNTMVALTFTPDTGSRVGSVTGCMFLRHATTHSTCTVPVSSVHTVTVRFDGHPELHFSSAPGPEAGTVSVTTPFVSCGTGCARIAPGSTVKLSASATSGNRLLGWTNCPSASGSICTLTMPQTALSVTARFAPVGRTDVVLAPSSGGTVTFAADNPTSQPCAGSAPVNGSCLSFAEGATVNVVAVPATGYRHVAGGTGCTWTVTNGVVSPQCSFVATGTTKTVLAAFSPVERTLDIDILGRGMVRVNSAFDCNAPGCTLTRYPHGYIADLEPRPGIGHTFGGWGTTCPELRSGNVCRVTLDGDKNVVATFDPLPANRSVTLRLAASEVSPDTNGVWSQTTLFVVVRNTGTSSVAATTVDITLPEFVGHNGSLSPSCWQQSRRVVRCAIGALAPNGSVTESLMVRPWYPRVPGDGHVLAAAIPSDGNSADNHSTARLAARHAVNTQYVKVTDAELGSIDFAVPGQTIQWAFDSTGTRRIEDTTLLNNNQTPLYTSPSITGFGAFRITFHQAGRYTYMESGSGRTGHVDVSLIAGIKSSNSIPIRWGATFLNQFSSIVVDCDKAVGTGAWQQWVRNSKQPGQTYYTTAGSGANHLRCRVRDTATGRTSGWSPVLTVSF